MTAPAEKDPLTRKVIGEAMHVHRILGPGFLETIYHTALMRRLQKSGLKVESQRSLAVHFEDEIIGNFLVDLIVEDQLILELKAVTSLNSAHEVQLVNYLTALRIEKELLLNFGGSSLEFKRKSRTVVPRLNALLRNPVNLVNPV
jgi:GxxExxY protein